MRTLRRDFVSWWRDLALLAICCLPQLAWSQDSPTWAKPAGPKPAWLTADADRWARMAQTRRALTRKVTYKFDQVPLDEAMHEISRQLRVPIRINDRALDNNGHERTALVSGQGREVRVSAMCEQLLKQFDLTLRVHESDLEVTSCDEAENCPTTIIYDLAFKTAEPSQVQGIMHVIATTVDPDRWRDYGGTGDSSMSPYGSALIVSTTDETHRKVVEFLSSLTSIPVNTQPMLGHKSASTMSGDQALPAGKLTLPAGKNYTLTRIVRVSDNDQKSSGKESAGKEPADKKSTEGAQVVKKFETMETPSWVDQQASSEEEALRAKLFKTISIDIAEGTTLQQALQVMLEVHKIGYWIDEVSLDETGVGLDQPVTISLEDTSLHEALQRLLHPLDLSYRIEGDRLEITSMDEAGSNLARRVYDLAYLSETPLDVEGLLLAITQSIDVEEWGEFGGTGNSVIRPMGSQLVMSAPEPTFSKLDSFFYQLSQVKPANLPERQPPHQYRVVSVQNIPGGTTIDIPSAGEFQLQVINP